MEMRGEKCGEVDVMLSVYIITSLDTCFCVR